ncbi:xylulokinase [Echinococcus granulosus]|uniref:Xylulokinase n=1 Tax=Echinococcus granulosus TaxID=6210 RepID=W6UC68_ECHGR|nr:xylulokinase [Echinococcus granulosus]EUB58226.1 xylulokinase [Echinococcus granulosus]
MLHAQLCIKTSMSNNHILFFISFQFAIFFLNFLVLPHYKALAWLKAMKKINRQVAFWYKELQQYDITDQYQKEKEHGDADALARRPTAAKTETEKQFRLSLAFNLPYIVFCFTRLINITKRRGLRTENRRMSSAHSNRSVSSAQIKVFCVNAKVCIIGELLHLFSHNIEIFDQNYRWSQKVCQGQPASALLGQSDFETTNCAVGGGNCGGQAFKAQSITQLIALVFPSIITNVCSKHM